MPPFGWYNGSQARSVARENGMSEERGRRACGACGKEYLFGKVYKEEVCPGCLSVRIAKKFVRTKEQSDRLLAAWRARFLLVKEEQEGTAA